MTADKIFLIPILMPIFAIVWWLLADYNNKRNPQKVWGEWRPKYHCKECGWLQEPKRGFDDFREYGNNCPDCGSKDLETVIARWEVSYDLLGYCTPHNHEIRHDG